MKSYKIIYLYSCFLSSRIPKSGFSADFLEDHKNEICSDTVLETSDKWEAIRIFADEYNTGLIDDTVIDYETGEDCTAIEFFRLLEISGTSAEIIMTSDLK